MADAKKKVNTEVVTPKARLSFPDLFQPRSYEGKDARYSAQFLVPKNTSIKDLKEVCVKAAMGMWGKELYEKYSKDKTRFVWPFKDGDSKTNDEGEILDGYEGHYVISATTKFPPEVVDKRVQPILKEDDIYGGCYVKALVSPYAWEYKNESGKVIKRGVGFNLLAVQKVAEGERFAKRANVAEHFESVDDGDDEIDTDEDDLDFM